MLADLPYRPIGPVAVSPDNRLIAIMTDSLLVLHTDTYEIVFHHPSLVRQGAFSDDSRTLSCVTADPDNAVLAVALRPDTSIVERILVAGGQPTKVIPAMNGQRLLVYLEEQPMISRLAVIDRLAGAEVYSERIFPGEGDVVSAANWDRAVYTNSGDPDRIEGSSSFKIFDIGANEPVEEILTRRTDVPPALRPCPVGQVQITPDHRWLIGLSAAEPQQLFLYDLDNERFADWRAFGDDVRLTHLSVQARP